MELDKPLDELPVEEFLAVDPKLDGDIRDVLGVQRAIEEFVTFGSTGPTRVEEQVRIWESRLGVDSSTDVTGRDSAGRFSPLNAGTP
jgi:argininosuccinate lyase